MRIAIVHPYPWDELRRGGERYLGDLAWYLSASGHTVDVITSTRGRPGAAVRGGVTVRSARRLEHPRLAARGLDAVQTHAVGALPALARRRYDVVHALTPWGALAAAAVGQRVVYTELGHPTPSELGRTPGGGRAYRLAVRRATAVTALSRSAASAVERCAGRRPLVVPPGVRTDRFAPHQVMKRDHPTLLFVSDASAVRKGVDLAIGALALLLPKRPGLRLELAGPGDHRWAMARLGLPPETPVARALDVVDVDRADDLASRYAAAHVTVLPSTHEAFGLAVVESLACGTPVVCSDGWGMDDVVTDPTVGRRFRPGDHRDLAAAVDSVLELTTDRTIRQACRDHGRRWDWATVVGPAHEELYREVAARRRGRPSAGRVGL